MLPYRIFFEEHDKWIDDYYRVKEKMEQEWYSGQKHQSWRLVPKQLLKLTWNTFAKYGRVNERALDKIWEIVSENVTKIMINTDIREGHNPEFFGHDEYGDITEQEWDRFFEFISDQSEGKARGRGGDWGLAKGHARYSDGARHLSKLADAVEKTTTPEDKLIAIDRILNMIHGIGYMAPWFVEGGISALEDISNAPVKGIHLTGRLT